MNEQFDVVKKEYETAKRYDDVWNNPVIKVLTIPLKLIPIVVDLADTSVTAALQKNQKKKLENFLNLIASDNEITESMVNDVEVIMEFAKMVDVINRLRNNQKVEFLANLFKNTVKNPERDYEEYEEFLCKLNDLSWRELKLLFFLEQSVQQNAVKTVNPINSKGTDEYESGQGYRPEEVWDYFLQLGKEQLNLEEGMMTAIISGTMRSGFVQHISILYPGSSRTVFVTTPYFRKFLSKIINK